MWKLFRRRRRRLVSISDYYKHRERELKRNPRCFEAEQEKVRQWAMRTSAKSVASTADEREENNQQLEHVEE